MTDRLLLFVQFKTNGVASIINLLNDPDSSCHARHFWSTVTEVESR
jgi:hypothetical protein